MNENNKQAKKKNVLSPTGSFHWFTTPGAQQKIFGSERGEGGREGRHVWLGKTQTMPSADTVMDAAYVAHGGYPVGKKR